MVKSKSRPDFATSVHLYSQLQDYVRAFVEGHIKTLFVIGPPGTGKSRCIAEVTGKSALWIDGNATAFRLYVSAYEYRDQPIVLDDVDGLYRDRAAVRLLKALCQTEPVKSVSWQSNAAALDQLGVPRKFSTTSPMVIIANEWKSLNTNVSAVEDRGHILVFEPSPLEIHKHASQWFWDQEIFDFVASKLHLIKMHSLRTYCLASELKRAGINWKDSVLVRCLSGKALEVARLKADQNFSSEEDRVVAFVAAGHGCRATYFNYSKQLRPQVEVPVIVLKNTSPPAAPILHQNILDLLKKRHGELGSG